jgi:hypothetical protein
MNGMFRRHGTGGSKGPFVSSGMLALFYRIVGEIRPVPPERVLPFCGVGRGAVVVPAAGAFLTGELAGIAFVEGPKERVSGAADGVSLADPGAQFSEDRQFGQPGFKQPLPIMPPLIMPP